MKKNVHTIFLSVLAIATVAVWVTIFRADRGVLTVAFLDVGQGDSIYIETPHGTQVLIDGGPDAYILSALGGVMPWHDRTIDLVLGTHPDKDHVGGLAPVIDKYDVSVIVWNGAEHDTKTYQNFLDAAHEEEGRGAQMIIARRGQRFVLDEDVTLDILFPNQDPNGWDTNDGSIVTMLTYGQEKFLLTGDAPQGVEKYLIGFDGKLLHANVLKLGHHGSKTSSAPEFLAAVSPEYAVVSAGKDNTYGHPNEEALSATRAVGATLLSTISSGTIIFEADGSAMKLR